ncbi:MAG TPA: hypothetical protein VFT02_05045 [Pyrinomonadaceae bacterium]|nr:hypothetical protein [Pyrinomonadaceae bacterium]
MLAYVFWHWPQASVERATYVARLEDFHHTLAANRPQGFRHSVVFAIEDADWLDYSGVAYEEWYLLDNSAAMDRLNEGAVSGACEEPHNAVARHAAGGTGGLYRLRSGEEILPEARFAVWLSKPEGVSYRDFYDALAPLTAQPNVALWGRQMTLGPTTEFCLHSQTPIQLPTGYTGRQLPLTSLIRR